MLPSMSDEDRVPLLRVLRALADLGFSTQCLSYDRAYKGAINGLFPAEQVVSNRWSVRRGDLPKVAAAFGLAPISQARAAAEHAAA